MSKFTHIICINGIERNSEYDKNYQHCIVSLRNQTNEHFIIADENATIETPWVIISYVSGVLHPDFVAKIQARFRPQPMEILTNGYIQHGENVFESICDTTYTIVKRFGEVVNSFTLPKEKIKDHLYCETTDFTDCTGKLMETQNWMKHAE